MSNDYSNYLRLDELLRLQRPRGGLDGPSELPELFFIVAHQASELWLKSLVAELEACEGRLAQPDSSLARVFVHLRRALAAALALESSVETLRHLGAEEFMTFREKLGTASGAQSQQFARLRELVGLGNPQGSPIERMIRELKPDLRQPELRAASGRKERTQAEWAALLITLQDLSSALWRWGVHHLDVVQRTIGRRPGTGGSTGASFLAANLMARPFATLWEPPRELMPAVIAAKAPTSVVCSAFKEE